MTGLLVLWLAAAQTASPPQNPPAATASEDVVVTAERAPEPRESVPAAVSVLTRGEIGRLPAENLGELLKYLPGFHAHFASAFGGAPIVSSRGFFGGGEAEYVQLLVDGVPVADVESGLADWRRIRAADVVRVEALRGPASALYGDTALGGLIHVFTRRGSAGSSGGSLSVSGGSFGSAGADVAARVPAGRMVLGAAATVSGGAGFRDHSAFEERGGDASVEFPGSGGRWTVSVSGSDREREDAGSLSADELAVDRDGSNPLFRFDREEARRGRAAVTYRREGSLPLRALLHASARDADTTRTLLVAAGVGDRIFRSLDTNGLGGTLEADKTFRLSGREARVAAGLDFARERLDTTYHAVDDFGERGERLARASGRRVRAGLFASGSWEPHPRLRVTAGARWDSIRDDFGREGGGARSLEAWSPRAGASVRLGRPDAAPLSLFLQASRAFKAPTLDQLFDPRPFSDFAGGTFRISNPTLLPQRASTLEAGASRRDGRSSFELILYTTDVDDEIDFDVATFRYSNIGRTRHRGIEAAARLFEDANVSPFFSYSWNRTEPRDGENRGRQLKNVPEHLFRPGISVALPAGIRIEVLSTTLAGRFLDDENAIPLDDATVFDLRLEKRFRRLRTYVDLLNVGDREWEELGLALSDFSGGVVPYYYPAAGFAARVGIDWTF
ncbi:MAG TPA: TonB-dependent receptor [Thermoanaerobaculia bacterium]|nr:TonB-dependent receptor [Thermoanaerobaculia bacterium]